MIEIHQDPVPLTVWEDGSIRIGGTRMLLYLVVEAWENGASPEYIVKQIYDSLSLADCYAAIAYYVRHKEELTSYFQQQDERVKRIWEEYTNTPEYQAKHQLLLDRIAQRMHQRGAAS